MRVLMISKAMVTAVYRTKLTWLNQLDANLVVGLVVPPRWGPLPFEALAEDSRMPIFVRPIRFNGRHHWHWYRGLDQTIRGFRPDLLHVDEEHYSLVTWQAMRLARRQGIPACFFTWQNLYKTYPWPFSKMERDVFDYACHGIAGNQEAAGVLRRKGYQGPVTVLPQFGVDPRFAPGDDEGFRARQGWSQQVVVGYVGRMITEKGVEDLIAAFAQASHQAPSLRLAMVGSGPWQAMGQAAARTLGIAERVTWIPWMASTDMPTFMRSLDILVLPSRTTAHWKEQFGRVLTEAMASGVAVVGSSSGEIPTVVGEAGIIFKEGDRTELAGDLVRLAQDGQLRQDLQQRGLERVRQHYTQQAVAAATQYLYRQILGQDKE